jgi:hypothetical protein
MEGGDRGRVGGRWSVLGGERPGEETATAHPILPEYVHTLRTTQAMTGGTHIKMVLPKASEGFDIGRATAAHGITSITDPHTATPNHLLLSERRLTTKLKA